MSPEQSPHQISLQPLMVTLEDLTRRIAALPEDLRDDRIAQLAEEMEDLLERIRETWHIDHGPLSYFMVPPARQGPKS